MDTSLPIKAPIHTASQGSSQSLLRVQGLSKSYVRGGLWRKRVLIAAANKVSFEIPQGQTFALVGVSGSGKSTVARCVTRLEKPEAGQILLDGTDISLLDARTLRPFRGRIQMVFQDAATAMNPRFTALEVIGEPLLIHSRRDLGGVRPLAHETARELMQEVGLTPDWMHRSIRQFSGGQRQRLALARALSLRPQLLVLDEALSGLDLSTQAQIANLLLDLQMRHSLTYLLISHDLSLVSHLADTIGVMSRGELVEVGSTDQIISSPAHDATKKLLASAAASAASLAAITMPPPSTTTTPRPSA